MAGGRPEEGSGGGGRRWGREEDEDLVGFISLLLCFMDRFLTAISLRIAGELFGVV